MAEHLSDEEQLQALKNWWKENGTTLVTAVLVGLIVYFGFQWWQNHQRQQAEQASALYSQLLDIVDASGNDRLSDEQKSTATYLIKQLQDDYSRSQYAVNASLFSAKMSVDDNDLPSAETSLKWAVEHANTHMGALAKLRLARVYASSQKYDDALQLLADKDLDVDAFGSIKEELRGDILLAKGEVSAAREAYVKAQSTVGDNPSFRQRLLPIKIANLPVSGEK